jgi:hypothetical protein
MCRYYPEKKSVQSAVKKISDSRVLAVVWSRLQITTRELQAAQLVQPNQQQPVAEIGVDGVRLHGAIGDRRDLSSDHRQACAAKRH